MDSNSSSSDELKKLERRLAKWSPAEDGLDHEAMLFAAGRASVRGRGISFAWPIASICMAATTLALGTWLSIERSERISLLREIESRSVATPQNSIVPMDPIPYSEPISPDAYLVLRRMWEQDNGDSWIGSASPKSAPNRLPVAQPPILRAWPPVGPSDSL